jgi:two-component system OmpR family response regulator
VVARVLAMARRRGTDPAHPTVLSFADVRIDLQGHQVFRGGTQIPVTATEFRLLEYFMRHPRRILSKEQILDAVWPEDFDGPVNIVETYVGYLRRKLNQHGPPLIHTTRLVGYVLREPVD